MPNKLDLDFLSMTPAEVDAGPLWKDHLEIGDLIALPEGATGWVLALVSDMTTDSICVACLEEIVVLTIEPKKRKFSFARTSFYGHHMRLVAKAE